MMRGLAALLLGLVGSAAACSVFVLDCKEKLEGGPVSARTMDFMRHAEVGAPAAVRARPRRAPCRHCCCHCQGPQNI